VDFYFENSAIAGWFFCRDGINRVATKKTEPVT
jgi:hypothetical protein